MCRFARPECLKRCPKAAASFIALSVSAAHGQLTAEIGAHDPSTLFKDGSNYYYFATGQGIAVRTSTNRTNWSGTASVFPTQPAWTTQAVPSFTGGFWAPDIAYFNGKYHLYYSISSWGTIDSAIGVATSPSLSSPTWTDQGKVVQSDAVWEAGPNTDTTGYNAIDPSILTDTDGKVWMAFGSYSSGILVTEINPSTGKRMNTSTLAATQVANNAAGGGWGSSIEGSALVKKGSYYYLFVNYGGCCSGVDSTYNVRVGRATSPLGPFLDKNGTDMRSGGGTMFLDDDGKMIGPGHFSYYSESGQDYFGYHYYNGDSNGAPTYGLRNLYWTSDNWPSYAVAAPDWNGAANSNWSSTSNWSIAGVPNGVGHVANFISNSANRYTVNVDTSGKTVSVINFRGNSAFQIGSTSGFGLTLDAASGDIATTINVADGNHRINAPITANDPLGVNVTLPTSTLTLAGSLAGVSLTKYGYGTLALSGVNTYTGGVLARYGTIDLSTGSSITTGNYTSIGAIVGENATMTLRGNASYTSASDFNVGDTGNNSTDATGRLKIQDTATLNVGTSGGLYIGSGFSSNTRAVGIVDQTGGTVTVTASADGRFTIGGRTSSLATGTYNLSNGTVNANTNLFVGGRGTGTINQTGGDFNLAQFASIGRYSTGNGQWNISAGTLDQTNAAAAIVVGESGDGVLQISGSAQISTESVLRLATNSGSTGTVFLNGGTVTTPGVQKGSGTATFTFNGGTLRAKQSNTTFIQGMNSLIVSTGGAAIDTNGFNITIPSALIHDSTLGAAKDGGLVKNGAGTLTLSGAGTFNGDVSATSGKLLLSQGLRNNASLSIGNGATVEINPSGLAAGVSKVSSISITGSSPAFLGKLELHNNDLVIDYTTGTTPYAAIIDMVKSGLTQLGGNGFGITSAEVNAQSIPGTTLAVTDNAAGGIAALSGYAVGSNTVLVKYTWRGDANLDGIVDGTDYALIDSGFAGSGNSWSLGDFNYDNTINGTDYSLIDTGFGSQSGALPEPSTIGLIVPAGLLLLNRRSRGRRINRA